MNKQRKTSHILNIFQYDETTGAVTLPSTLDLTAPASNDDSTKVPTTAWVRALASSLGYVTLSTDQSITGLKTIVRVGAAVDVLNFKIGTDTLYGLKVFYSQNELVESGEATWSFASTFNNGSGTGITTTPISFFRGVLVTGQRLLSSSVNANLLDYYGNNPSGRYPIYAYNTGVQQFASSIIVGETAGVVNGATGVIADLPSGVVANFKGRVIGSNAVNSNEFVTLSQLTSGYVNGSGTTNYVSKFTASGSVGNSLIFDNGTTVLIGTTTAPTPVMGVSFPFSVTSSASTRIRIDSTQATPNAGVGLYANGVQKFSFAMFGATSDFTIYNDALLAASILVKGNTNNILIGTSTDNSSKLRVNGTGWFDNTLTATSFVKNGGAATEILAADGSVITAGTGITISGGTISSSVTGGVASFNTRTGAVTLSSGDVTTALGFTPISSYTETDTLATVTARGASTASGITFTAPGGTVLLKHAVSEVDAWIFQENAANWGIYWKNNPSGNHTFGGYTTVGAETFGMSAANSSGNGVLTSNFVGATSAYAQWMLSNYTGYIWSASTVFAAGDMRAPVFYDSNNTAYYIDGASTSNFNEVQFQNGKWYTVNNTSGNSTNMYIRPDGNNTYVWRHIYGGSGTGHSTGAGGYGIYNDTLGGDYSAIFNYAGFVTFPYSARSPIFYDSNDTSYYVDPNSLSNLARAAFYGNDNQLYINTITNGASGIFFQENGSNRWETYHYQGKFRFYNYATASEELSIDNSGGFVTARTSFRAPIFYDSDDTGYYADFNSTSNSAIRLRGGMLVGPNTTWGAYLQVGGNGHVSASYANVVTSNGNLHMDPATSCHMYLNYYVNGIIYLNGATYSISSNGSYYNGRSELVTINYNNDSNSTYQLLWGSGNSVYGSAQVYVNPSSDIIYARGGYVSPGNAWGTSDSAFFPNGITTAGTTNWIYGSTTHIGNATGNGAGHDFYSSGSSYSTGNLETNGSYRAPIFYDRNDTTYYIDLNSTTSGVIRGNFIFNDYGAGIVGTYTSTRYQGVFAMGDAYKLPIDGTGPSNLYGITWSHPNAGGVAGNLNTHGALFLENGTFLAAISGSIRSRDDMRAPIFYDSNNTGFYTDPNSTSKLSTLNVNNLNSGNVINVGSTNNGGESVATTSARGLELHSAGDRSYWIGKREGAWTQPLDVAFYTGIRYHAHNAYNGHRFFTTGYDSTESFSIGNGDNNVRVANTLFVSGDARAPIFYDISDTGYYLNPNGLSYLYSLELAGGAYFRPRNWIQLDSSYGIYWPNNNGAHIYPNTTTSYTHIRLDGSRGGYGGIWDSYSSVAGIMYDSGGNGGVYREANSRWYFYYHLGNDCMGVGTSSTSSTYSLYLNKGIYAPSRIDATIYYDASNTGYYLDPNGGSYLASSVEVANGAFISYGAGGYIYMSSVQGSFGGYMRFGQHAVFESINGGYHFYVLDASGVGVVKTAGSQSWAAHSDSRIKNIHSVMENNLSKLESISPVYYSFNYFEDNRNRIGLIAQEVQEHFPELVDTDPKTDNLVLDYTGLIPVLLGAIKELKNKVEDLESRL